MKTSQIRPLRLFSDRLKVRLVSKAAGHTTPLFFTPSLMMLASSFHSAENVKLDRNIRISFIREPNKYWSEHLSDKLQFFSF